MIVLTTVYPKKRKNNMLNLIIDRFKKDKEIYSFWLAIDEDTVIFEHHWHFHNPKPDTQVFDEWNWGNVYSPIALPLMKRSFPSLFANKIVGVQPMGKPKGIYTSIRSGYSSVQSSVPHANQAITSSSITTSWNNSTAMATTGYSYTSGFSMGISSKPDPLLTLAEFDKLITHSYDKKYLILNIHHPILDKIRTSYTAQETLCLRDYWKARMRFGKKEVALIEYGKRFFNS
jgi:hypothetical protein